MPQRGHHRHRPAEERAEHHAQADHQHHLQPDAQVALDEVQRERASAGGGGTCRPGPCRNTAACGTHCSHDLHLPVAGRNRGTDRPRPWASAKWRGMNCTSMANFFAAKIRTSTGFSPLAGCGPTGCRGCRSRYRPCRCGRPRWSVPPAGPREIPPPSIPSKVQMAAARVPPGDEAAIRPLVAHVDALLGGCPRSFWNRSLP